MGKSQKTRSIHIIGFEKDLQKYGPWFILGFLDENQVTNKYCLSFYLTSKSVRKRECEFIYLLIFIWKSVKK
ncbi:hypothetical protein C7460_1419 [Marinoscillum furvescens DSM 4134]|uniref:Uncharacterized protein n=1 Tax=Marinoscillum furvescens DSM 4134 TaxID=1122208 RepID=A0A3D9KWJ6_MARFU|nr:hypothetical protein C7460_1419 [Marinoscillum furvescens DSM 4134]